MHDRQSPAELEAHYGPGGPVAAVLEWIQAVFDEGDMRASWPLTDPGYRLCLAQAWVWANRGQEALSTYDLELLAEEFAEVACRHPLWGAFAETTLEEHTVLEFDLESWGFASRPRPVVPDYELVFLIRTDGETVLITEPTDVRAHPFLVHHTPGGWRFAGYSGIVPEPSWPPKPPPEWSPADY